MATEVTQRGDRTSTNEGNIPERCGRGNDRRPTNWTTPSGEEWGEPWSLGDCCTEQARQPSRLEGRAERERSYRLQSRDGSAAGARLHAQQQ